jgi:hypothetical protein
LPPVAEHLEAFKKPLQTRQDQGDFWWELRPCDYYDVFIKTNDVNATRDAIETFGGKTRIAVGNIITASIPETAAEEIAQETKCFHRGGQAHLYPTTTWR